MILLIRFNRLNKHEKETKNNEIKSNNKNEEIVNKNVSVENVQKANNTDDKIKTDYEDKKTIEQSYPFKKVYLLTKNEWNFFKRLKLIIDKYNLSIISKVRLADLIEVDKNKSADYQADFERIKSKHIDFAIVKSDNMEVKFLIELDDGSHNSSDRFSRDIFIKKVCEVTGYRLIRTLGDTQEIEKELQSNYSAFKKPEVQQKKNNTDINDKIIKSMLYKINNIEKILSEVDEKPYIIEKED